jgi:hypothetical protein
VAEAVEDEHRSSMPLTATTDENVDKISEIVKAIGIFYERAQNVITSPTFWDFTRWDGMGPRLLSAENKRTYHTMS